MRMKKEFEELQENFNYWVKEVKQYNLKSCTDINRYSEGFLAELLSILKKENYVNLNQKEKKNYPGIDIGCKESGIAYQISSNVDSRKVIETYRKVITNSIANAYPYIRFLEISQPTHRHKFKDETMKKISKISDNKFEMNHIVNVHDLIQEIEALYDEDRERFEQIKELVTRNLGYKINKKTDSDILGEILNYLNRAAFTTPFYRECSLNEFLKALVETNSLIRTGKIGNDRSASKANIANIKDPTICKELNELTDGINTLRKLTLKMSNKGDITEEDLMCDEEEFRNCFTCCGECIDDLRGILLKYAEKIAAKNNVKFQINIRFKKQNDWNIKKGECLSDQLEHVYDQMRRRLKVLSI